MCVFFATEILRSRAKVFYHFDLLGLSSLCERAGYDPGQPDRALGDGRHRRLVPRAVNRSSDGEYVAQRASDGPLSVIIDYGHGRDSPFDATGGSGCSIWLNVLINSRFVAGNNPGWFAFLSSCPPGKGERGLISKRQLLFQLNSLLQWAAEVPLPHPLLRPCFAVSGSVRSPVRPSCQ